MSLNNPDARTDESGAAPFFARQAAIAQRITLVHSLAKRFQFRVPPCITLDDLIAAGTIGLIQAVDRFQSSRGLKFESYARHRITGAMLDFLRGEDPLSRDERRRVRATAGTDWQVPTTVRFDDLTERGVYGVHRPTRLAESRFASRIDLERARRGLSQRENLVISLLFEVGLTNAEIARKLGVTEGRISQIKHAALTKVRRHLLGAA